MLKNTKDISPIALKLRD